MEPIIATATEFYCKDNVASNHTDMYDLANCEKPTPILRRGCTFYLAIRFKRNYVPTQDVVKVRFALGPKPNVEKGTRIILPVNPKNKTLEEDPNVWSICVCRVDGNDVQLQVHISAQAPVGIWKCSFQTNIAGHKEEKYVYKVPEDLYIIFNPWCPQDGVYMEKEEERNEYVLNETGKIWCGTFKNPTGKHWVYGQFDDIVLPAAMLLLDKSNLPHSERGNPVLVTRAISAIINSVDDGGLIEGRCDGQYKDGTSPFAWTGSLGIMDQFLSSGGKSVKYGQCWVFSGATVTTCRTLGIPCRSTTNYVSAHGNGSMTVAKYFDISGKKIEESDEIDCKDSCWNFHVWNDVWMARPDLPPGYGGWQIIDGTPQETIDQVSRCGPTSVAALKKGEVGYLYDTPLVFSKLNADIVHFKEDKESDYGYSRMSINKYHAGKRILTKRMAINDDQGVSDMWDITDLYKNPQEHFCEIIPNKNNDLFFNLIDIDTVKFGESFEVVVQIENKSNEERTINAVLAAESVYYTGAAAHEIKKHLGIFKIAGKHYKTIRIHVRPEDYIDKLVDHGLFKIYAIATVEETKQTWIEEDDFTMTLPKMNITIPDTVKVGKPFQILSSFKNPLNCPLTNCVYTVEGPGLPKPRTVTYPDINPEENVTFTKTLTAKKVGGRKAVISFTSKQIQNITAGTRVNVVE